MTYEQKRKQLRSYFENCERNNVIPDDDRELAERFGYSTRTIKRARKLYNTPGSQRRFSTSVPHSQSANTELVKLNEDNGVVKTRDSAGNDLFIEAIDEVSSETRELMERDNNLALAQSIKSGYRYLPKWEIVRDGQNNIVGSKTQIVTAAKEIDQDWKKTVENKAVSTTGYYSLTTRERATPWPAIVDLFRYLIEKNIRYKIMSSGRSAGKSMAMSYAAALNITGRNPFRASDKVNIMVMRYTERSIEHSIFDLTKMWLERLNLMSEVKITKSPHEILHVPTGNKLRSMGFFGDSHNTNKLKSVEAFDIFIIEESDDLREPDYKVLNPTVRKPGSEIWFSFNPTSKRSFMWELKEQLEASEQKGGDIGSYEGWAWYLHTNYLDNPFNPPAMRKIAEDEKARNEEEYKNIWLGEPMEKSEWHILRDKIAFIEPNEVPGIEMFTTEGIGPRRGIDFGSRCAYIEAGLLNNCLYIFHEWTLDHASTVFPLQDHLKERIPIDIRHEKAIFVDSADVSAIDLLQHSGFNIKPAKKPPDSVLAGYAWLRKLDKIFISTQCPIASKEMWEIQFAKDRETGLPLEVPDKKAVRENQVWHDHTIDAVRYAFNIEILGLDRRTLGMVGVSTVEV